MITEEDVRKAKEISIEDFLISNGYLLDRKGGRLYCQSPFSYDRTPSFCVYPTNTFYDWANGFGGDIIKLVMELDGIDFSSAVIALISGDREVFKPSIAELYQEKDVDLSKFFKVRKDEESDIINYAFSRSIFRNYKPSVFIVKDDNEFIRRPSVGYVHVDENMEECGIKMRDINPYKDRRFSARGSQKFYILKNTDYYWDGRLYIVESESSANSLFEYLCIIKEPCVVVSFGSWNNIPKSLPDSINRHEKRSIIIDYDGNEELYRERIERFDHLNAKEIKLELPKGEDINSLFKSGKIHKYKNLFKK